MNRFCECMESMEKEESSSGEGLAGDGERGREGDGDGRRDDRVWEGREEWSKPKRKGGAESGRDLGEGKKGRKIGRKKKRPEGGRKSVQKRSNCDPVVWAGIS